MQGDDAVSEAAASTAAADAREVEATEQVLAAANSKCYLICWGNNQYNQLGVCMDLARQESKDKVESKSLKPLRVAANKVGIDPTLLGPDALGVNVNFPSIRTVACGEYHTLAVAQDGTL